MSNGLRVRNVRIRPPTPVSEEAAAHHVQERQHVDVEIENTTTTPMHVWVGMRAYAYDSDTRVLEIFLAEPAQAAPTGIEIVSDHPRVPPQVVVGAGARTTIDVPVLTVIRRRVPGAGLGLSFVDVPIADIQQVTLHIQYADIPFQAVIGETPEEQRNRLQAHGQTIDVTVTPTSS